jgi:hypothetical protein
MKTDFVPLTKVNNELSFSWVVGWFNEGEKS